VNGTIRAAPGFQLGVCIKAWDLWLVGGDSGPSSGITPFRHAELSSLGSPARTACAAMRSRLAAFAHEVVEIGSGRRRLAKPRRLQDLIADPV
jgi:hypothetical protein